MLKIRLDNIKIREDIEDSNIVKIACRLFEIQEANIIEWKILRKSIDARNKEDIFFNYSIMLILKETTNIVKLQKRKNVEIIKDNTNEEKIEVKRKSNLKPVIIGAGPAGLFCALTLVNNGIQPIIIEQGKKVEERKIDVDNFLLNGILNPLSNVQFGEGGAGTFSDGKLTTNLHNPLCNKVIEEFVKFGAPEQIAYINKPHIGTDNLIYIIANIRNYIIDKGGEFLFETKVTDFTFVNNKLKEVICKDNKKNKQINIEADTAVLAIGHSSRDMFETLYRKNVKLEKKTFSVGVRIEHSQEMINASQYGKNPKLKLPPAEYKIAYHGKERSCYTFCMCPGGTVIASSSETNTIVTNGMSTFARDGQNANSAVLVNVTPEDFEGKSPLEGMYFQKELEEKAFKLGGENYFAPIQRVEDFFNNRKTEFIGKIKPTYKPGVTKANLQEILPKFVSDTIKEGLLYFNTKIQGFAMPDAILTGVETRSSSPVTIKRNEEYMSNIEGLYPCGEGAGYAGGIMSAAVDGIKVAQAILVK